MTDSTRYIGPRGWAALVLAGGAALSAPFLRSPSTSPGETQPLTGTQPELDFSNSAWPDLRETSLTPKEVATNLSDQDWAAVARLQKDSGAVTRKVSGDLPSTSVSRSLPSWADRGPRVDQLVNDSIRTEPLAATAPSVAAALEPLRPWMGHGMKRGPEPLPAAPLTGDYAFASPDPNARWSVVDSRNLSSNSGAINSNQAAQILTERAPVGPIAVAPPAQVVWNSHEAPGMDRNAPQAGAALPKESLRHFQMGALPPVGSSVSSQNRNLGLAPEANRDQSSTSLGLPSLRATSASAGLPDTVSAPMVSSQSGRAAPHEPKPTIDSPRPTKDSAPPKNFIKQPSKRA